MITKTCLWNFWFILIGFILYGCGLPSSTGVNINNLNKPELEVYNRDDALYLEIVGFYPADEYPDFIGYNIYVGDNNNVDQVIDRIMFISSDNELPSYEVSLNESTTNVTIPLTDIRFRFSQHATSDDIPDGMDRESFYSKPLMNYEKYYFVVEAVETSRTGRRTDAIKTIFVNYKHDISWDYSNTLNGPGVDVFADLMVEEDYFIFPQHDSYIFAIAPGGAVNSIYQTIPENDLSYNDKPYKPYRNHIYFLRARNNAASVDEYLALWVTEIDEKKITVSYGHKKEILSDFVGGVSRIGK